MVNRVENGIQVTTTPIIPNVELRNLFEENLFECNGRETYGKITIIKALRDRYLGLGLREAKEAVEMFAATLGFTGYHFLYRPIKPKEYRHGNLVFKETDKPSTTPGLFYWHVDGGLEIIQVPGLESLPEKDYRVIEFDRVEES